MHLPCKRAELHLTAPLASRPVRKTLGQERRALLVTGLAAPRTIASRMSAPRMGASRMGAPRMSALSTVASRMAASSTVASSTVASRMPYSNVAPSISAASRMPASRTIYSNVTPSTSAASRMHASNSAVVRHCQASAQLVEEVRRPREPKSLCVSPLFRCSGPSAV